MGPQGGKPANLEGVRTWQRAALVERHIVPEWEQGTLLAQAQGRLGGRLSRVVPQMHIRRQVQVKWNPSTEGQTISSSRIC